MATTPFTFESSYAEAVPELSTPWEGAQAPAPRILVLDEGVAAGLGVDPAALSAAFLAGSGQPGLAQAYSGHQFGGFSSRLGDGRALLLGEVLDASGARRDLHLKGSGRTPFSRGGDGKAAVGPMLREHLVSEAIHALGIPTSRALAVVATGETVAREVPLPGAVLARVAASHLRVGTFEYAAGSPEVLERLADYAIARHHPAAAEADEPYLAFYEAVVEAQAALVARWMLVGFVHGVMNTDNMTISGETIDYGPCAFMETYDPATVFSSIDHGGRYAYGNQPAIAQWNLARLAETLLPVLARTQEAALAAATWVLESFPRRHRAHWERGMAAKLGLEGDAGELATEFLGLLEQERLDGTTAFRGLSAVARGGEPLTPAFADWTERWRARLAPGAAEAMDRVNPVYLPRNVVLEDALSAATAGDMAPYERLLEAVRSPFDERPGLELFAVPGRDADGFRTFCGT